MSYVWGDQGPAFEIPSCFRTENRFLTVRAAVLFAFSLALVWLALADPDLAQQAAAAKNKIVRGDPAVHVAVALVLLVLCIVDLVIVMRQRRVLVATGQPSALAPDLGRPGTGTASGATWIRNLLGRGTLPATEYRGRYRRVLMLLAPTLGQSPAPLQAFLRMRLAHLLFASGLLLAMGITWVAAGQSPSTALSAVLYGLLMLGLLMRSAWISREAPSPTALLATVAVVMVLGVLLARFGNVVPQLARLANAGLPMACTVLLASVLLFEALALLAARTHVGVKAKVDVGTADASIEFPAEAGRLMQEIERELHRYWAEGVPNRRHAWEPLDPQAPDHAPLEVLAVEESQPLIKVDTRSRDQNPVPGQGWLMVGQVLSLLLTLAGGVMLVRLAWQHIENGATPLGWVLPSAVAIVAAGIGARTPHLLWSRVEALSKLLWFEVKCAPAVSGVRQNALRAVVASARSQFYAVGEPQPGSRVLLEVTGDAATARKSLNQIRGYAERPGVPAAAAAPVGVATPGARAAAAAGMAPRVAAPTTSAAAAAGRAARFCSNCGTPVLAGARFCQQCGFGLGA